LAVAEARKWTPLGRSISQAAAYTGMLSRHCGCVMALRHAEKDRLIFLEVAGALTITPKCHGRYVAILRLCCTLAARPEIASYACVQKNV
jgi:hypothetical protein